MGAGAAEAPWVGRWWPAVGPDRDGGERWEAEIEEFSVSSS